MKLFIVGKKLEADSGWEFAGVFDTEQAAHEACLNADYFIGPTILNQRTPIEKEPWPNTFYPKV